MVNKSVLNKLKTVLKRYGEYEILDASILNGSQNKVYKVNTDKGIYVVKEFSLDAIKNYYYLRKRKEQIRISKVLNDNGIKTILPIMINDNSFIFFKKHYYVVYDYSISRPLEEKEITLKHISTLATTQSKIHKLNISSSLTCFYKHINIDFDKQLNIVKKKDMDLYNLIKDNLDKLKEIVNMCNSNLKDIKSNLCISHNDYKLLNILWDKDKMFLIDFDATGLSNPTCCLCESAFTFSKINNNKVNYSFYEEYLRSYLNNYGKIKEDFRCCLFSCLNGKLQWLNYMFSKNSKKENNYIDGTKYMINEFLLYYENINKFNEIYMKITK